MPSPQRGRARRGSQEVGRTKKKRKTHTVLGLNLAARFYNQTSVKKHGTKRTFSFAPLGIIVPARFRHIHGISPSCQIGPWPVLDRPHVWGVDGNRSFNHIKNENQFLCRLSHLLLFKPLHAPSYCSYAGMRVKKRDTFPSYGKALPSFAVGRLVGHNDGPIPLVRMTGMYDSVRARLGCDDGETMLSLPARWYTKDDCSIACIGTSSFTHVPTASLVFNRGRKILLDSWFRQDNTTMES